MVAYDVVPGFTLIANYNLPDGVGVAELSYDGTSRDFLASPVAIKVGDRAYGRASHNSDSFKITYRTDKIFAVPV